MFCDVILSSVLSQLGEEDACLSDDRKEQQSQHTLVNINKA